MTEPLLRYVTDEKGRRVPVWTPQEDTTPTLPAPVAAPALLPVSVPASADADADE